LFSKSVYGRIVFSYTPLSSTTGRAISHTKTVPIRFESPLSPAIHVYHSKYNFSKSEAMLNGCS
jgi:hypothetical protein